MGAGIAKESAMYLTGISSRIGRLTIAAVMTYCFASTAFADQADMTVTHDFYTMIPEGCRPEGHEGMHNGAPPTREEMMKKMADEFGLTGQQQQDLQILVADYAVRLQEIAKLMSESGRKLSTTEPGDPYYWPLAQEVSATASASAGETVILLSEMREKIYTVLTADQRADIKRRIEERRAKCQPQAEVEQPAG
jgi:Spy/CpxP family protein refolding chaperone